MIVDASTLVAVIANEPEKGRIVELTRGADLIAPHSVHWEIGNAFSAMLKRGRIGIEQALEALALYHQIPIRFVDVELDRALEIADELEIYAYDAYLIRCAQKYRHSLITLDRALMETAKHMGVEAVEVAR